MAKIYISGPITGIQDYKKRFAEAEELIKSIHAEPVNPANNPEGLTYREYIDIGMKQLMACDMICMLPGWQDSTGAYPEHRYAQAVDMPVLHTRLKNGNLSF
jgi:hypothetical protein